MMIQSRFSDSGNAGGAIARLADPGRLGQTALEGGSVDVVVSVPVDAFAAGYGLMRPIMDDGAPHLEAWLTEEGRTEEELRLLCGLYCTIKDNLPMDDAHHLKHMEANGFDQHLDEFAIRRVAHMKRSADLLAVLEVAVRGVARFADGDEARGNSPAMHVDSIINAIWSGLDGNLDRLGGAAETLTDLISDEKSAKARREVV